MFVGLATAISTRPPEIGQPESFSRVVYRELWPFLAVLMAYAPDVIAQVLHLAGWKAARVFCHSVLFSAAFPVICAFTLRITGGPAWRGFFVTLFSVLAHDILDIGQATDKAIFWPFSDRPVFLHIFNIPSGLFQEALLFGGTFLLFILARKILGHVAGFVFQQKKDPSPLQRRLAAINRTLILSVVIIAVVTHTLRDLRERQLESARALVYDARYADGLTLLDASERWPSNAKPGRADYLRGVAFLGMGDRGKAESYLLGSFRADPSHLWVVVDLAKYYARSPHPLPLRKNLASPYLEILRRDFTDRKEATDAVAHIEEILSYDPPSR